MSWLIPPKTHPLLLFSPFSLLFSFIYITHSTPPLLHFQSPSPSVTTLRPPVTLSPHTLSPLSSSSVTTPCSHVTLSPLPLLLSPVPLLLSLLFPCYYPLFLCYSVFSYPVSPLLILCYYCSVPLLLCLLISCYYPLFSCYPVFLLPCPPSLSCKECLPVLSTGAFTLSKTRPFKHAEHAFLAPWRRPSCM